MSKYCPEIVNEICALVASGKYKVVDLCKKVGIHHETYYEWQRSKPEFSERLKEAEKDRLKVWNDMANSGMFKKLDVFDYTEETIEYIDDPINPGNPIIKSKKVTKKLHMPSDTMIIFAKTNLDPENFKHKQEIKHSGEIKTNLTELSTEELVKRAQAIKEISDSK